MRHDTWTSNQTCPVGCKNVDEDPSEGSNRQTCPIDYGWKENQNRLELDWFLGNSVPESLTAASADDGERMEATFTDDEQSDNAWSEDSDDSDGDCV